MQVEDINKLLWQHGDLLQPDSRDGERILGMC